MNETHTSYEFSRKLKAFLGESAPEPMGSDYYSDRDIERELILHYNMELLDNMYPAYQLHDLLSKPFCEGLFPKFKGLPIGCQSGEVKHWHDIAIVICRVYINWGLPEVEKALTEMMEAK